MEAEGPVRSLLKLSGQEMMVDWQQWRWSKGPFSGHLLETKLTQSANALATGKERTRRNLKRGIRNIPMSLPCLVQWIFMFDPHNYPLRWVLLSPFYDWRN